MSKESVPFGQGTNRSHRDKDQTPSETKSLVGKSQVATPQSEVLQPGIAPLSMMVGEKFAPVPPTHTLKHFLHNFKDRLIRHRER